jgi:hypothetical protein
LSKYVLREDHIRALFNNLFKKYGLLGLSERMDSFFKTIQQYPFHIKAFGGRRSLPVSLSKLEESLHVDQRKIKAVAQFMEFNSFFSEDLKDMFEAEMALAVIGDRGETKIPDQTLKMIDSFKEANPTWYFHVKGLVKSIRKGEWRNHIKEFKKQVREGFEGYKPMGAKKELIDTWGIQCLAQDLFQAIQNDKITAAQIGTLATKEDAYRDIALFLNGFFKIYYEYDLTFKPRRIKDLINNPKKLPRHFKRPNFFL